MVSTHRKLVGLGIWSVTLGHSVGAWFDVHDREETDVVHAPHWCLVYSAAGAVSLCLFATHAAWSQARKRAGYYFLKLGWGKPKLQGASIRWSGQS